MAQAVVVAGIAAAVGAMITFFIPKASDAINFEKWSFDLDHEGREKFVKV